MTAGTLSDHSSTASPAISSPTVRIAAGASVSDEAKTRGPLRWWIFLGLIVVLGWFIYHPVRNFEFLNFDDDNYLSENPWLKKGLTEQSVRWAFIANLTEFSKRAEYWSPLTLLSRLADAQIYGVNPGPFHVTSALIHLLNAALLGVALWYLTGAWRRSVAVALLFLVHPLNVEPVCWLSARKDLLSATFFFATLLAYAHFLRRQNVWRYLILLGAFCACLMSKPMGVTVPFVLILLDWWPLGRWKDAGGNRAEYARLVAEKIPLLLLAAAAAALAVRSQQDWGALASGSVFTMQVRVENALVSYALYFRRVFWPSDLCLYYPHPGPSLPLWHVAIAGAMLVAISVGAVLLRRRAPYFLAGWLWFGVVLGPVIGLMQIGSQAMADRYAYPSVIGLFIMIAWGGAAVLRERRQVAWTLGTAALAALALCASRQVFFFRDSEAAFSRAIAVTQDNVMAHLNLGCAAFDKGNFQKARENYIRTVQLDPDCSLAWNNLAFLENKLGHEDVAIHDYLVTLKLDPKNQLSLLFLGRIYKRHAQYPQAEVLFKRLLEEAPNLPQPYTELGDVYAAQKRWDDAAGIWSEYVKSRPGDETGRRRLAEAEAARGTKPMAE